jgi:hypothetical protein
MLAARTRGRKSELSLIWRMASGATAAADSDVTLDPARAGISHASATRLRSEGISSSCLETESGPVASSSASVLDEA